jgi:hypothetical protein
MAPAMQHAQFFQGTCADESGHLQKEQRLWANNAKESENL